MQVRFGDCVFDPAARELRRSGSPVPLSPLAHTLLTSLLDERPRAIPQAELKRRLWPDAVVGRTSLARLVTEVRQAIGDEPGDARWIRTHHGFGYSFCGAVTDQPDESADAGYRLLWGPRQIPLRAGVHVIGRAPDCEVRVETPETSRHHARILIGPEGAFLDDLGSKHGTQVAGRPITGRTRLRGGDEITIGTAVLILLGPVGSGATETL